MVMDPGVLSPSSSTPQTRPHQASAETTAEAGVWSTRTNSSDQASDGGDEDAAAVVI